METKMTQAEMVAAVDHLRTMADALHRAAEEVMDYSAALREAILAEVE